MSEAIENSKPFVRGNLSGRWLTDQTTLIDQFGQLPYEESEQLKAALADKDVYVVYSFRTPIGWTFSQEWKIPHVLYSNTTIHHQNLLRLMTE